MPPKSAIYAKHSPSRRHKVDSFSQCATVAISKQASTVGNAKSTESVNDREILMRNIYKLALCLVLIVPVTDGNGVWAAEMRSEHTYKLSEGEERPPAALDDASWLVGSWVGTAFGSNFEEVWNAPSAGSMVGMFKVFDGDEVSFYEILLMTVEEGTLSLKVKHFNADFTAWEEKPDYINFRLAKIEENALHFSGISFYRRDDDHIDGYIVIRDGDEVREHPLMYERRK